MKRYFLPAIKLTLISLLFISGIYTLVLLGAAHLVPGKGQGQKIQGARHIYFANIGQSFTADRYFWSRPSAVNYNAAGSGGSNKGPTNPEYLATVQARIDSFMVHNPDVDKRDIPVDLVTASGSGLDPDISVQAALIQIKRIAKIRQLPVASLAQLVKINTEGPLLGIFGPSKINVLRLNLALDKLKQRH